MELQMELTPEQKISIERLYENESLTDNLTDNDARAVLEWAQQQIIAETDGELVKQAVRAANQSGETGVASLIAQASAFLGPALAARESDASSAMKMDDATKETEAMRERKAEEMGAISTDAPGTLSVAEKPAVLSARQVSEKDARLEASGSETEQRLPTARADAIIGASTAGAPSATAAPAPSKKTRRKSKRKKKSSQ